MQFISRNVPLDEGSAWRDTWRRLPWSPSALPDPDTVCNNSCWVKSRFSSFVYLRWELLIQEWKALDPSSRELFRPFSLLHPSKRGPLPPWYACRVPYVLCSWSDLGSVGDRQMLLGSMTWSSVGGSTWRHQCACWALHHLKVRFPNYLKCFDEQVCSSN